MSKLPRYYDIQLECQHLEGWGGHFHCFQNGVKKKYKVQLISYKVNFIIYLNVNKGFRIDYENKPIYIIFSILI